MCEGYVWGLIMLWSLITVHCLVQICVAHQEVWPPASKFFNAVVIIPYKGWLYNTYWEWLLFWNCLLTLVGNIRRPSAALTGWTFYQIALSGGLKSAVCLTVWIEQKMKSFRRKAINFQVTGLVFKWFMESVLLEQEKIKLCHKWNFVESKTVGDAACL
jgi:hypothetical protein